MAFLYRPWHAKNKWKGHLWASCCPGPGLRGYLCRARPPLPACLRDACDGRCRPPRCSPRHVQSKTHKTRWRRTSLLKLRGPSPLNFCSAICLRVSPSQRSLVTHRLGLWNAKAFPFCFSITIGPGTEDTGSREDVLLAAGGGGGGGVACPEQALRRVHALFPVPHSSGYQGCSPHCSPWATGR